MSQATEPPRTASPRGRALLHGCALLALLLRIGVHHGRVFEGDELGTLAFLERGYGYLLTHFEFNLTMNWYIALLKGVSDLFGRGHWVLIVPSLAGGLATIYLVHALARRFLGEAGAVLAALLAACCPTFVDSSVELRSYGVFNAFALATFVLALAWLDARAVRTALLCAASAALAFLMHPNALYPLCFVGVWVLIELFHDRRGWIGFVVPMGVAAVLVVAAYLPLREGMQAYRVEWTIPPPAPWDYLPELARHYFGSGWLAVPGLLLVGLGLWSAVRERAPAARLGLGLLVPLCVASLIGVATLRGAYARFLGPMLPILLVLVVRGADVVGRLSSMSRTRRALRAASVALVLGCWIPELARKVDDPRDLRTSELTAFLAQSEPAELFLIGRNLERFLSAEALSDPRGAFAAWMARSAAAHARSTIVVSDERPLATSATRHVFGGIQAVVYTEPEPRARIQHLHDDLLATLAGFPIDGELMDHYGALMTLAQALGKEDELLRFTVYYYECFLRSKHLQEFPDKLLSMRTTMSKQKLVKNLMAETTPAGRPPQ